ncbi:hypothetical protein BsIDN1_01140 [Bacillus safensis]|uniref:Tetrapyrrole methylase domain-containing protein n=1 Tax=Bacillus safensis TaxID=561879 RepID=A0A5S9M4R5_BACIA|nr:hypothetical protein BsIDN1_01140 [Bacillus safensis]
MAGKITVVGLGAGDMDQLTLGVYKQLKQAKEVFMRTQDHPLTAELMQEVPALTFLMKFMKSTISLIRCIRKLPKYYFQRQRKKRHCVRSTWSSICGRKDRTAARFRAERARD